MIFGLVGFIIGLLPSINLEVTATSESVRLISIGLFFFPIDTWLFIIGNVSLWLSVQFGWSIIEWVYKKIPFIE